MSFQHWVAVAISNTSLDIAAAGVQVGRGRVRGFKGQSTVAVARWCSTTYMCVRALLQQQERQQLCAFSGRSEVIYINLPSSAAAAPSDRRTDSSYARWEEALKAWNDVRSLSKDLARQVRIVLCSYHSSCCFVGVLLY